MVHREAFGLTYDVAVKEHLRAVEPKYHGLIRDAIEGQLRYEPDTETRNRKPLDRPVGYEATWELRCGPDNRFRVLYAVNYESREVQIAAVGVKERNRLYIGGEEVGP